MNEPIHNLDLVVAPAQAVSQDDNTPDRGAGIHALETRLRGLFQAPDADARPDAVARSLPRARIPFAFRMTATQVLEVAADADFRAEILHDLANTRVRGREQRASGRISMGTGDRRAADLREVAADLRRIAANLVGY